MADVSACIGSALAQANSLMREAVLAVWSSWLGLARRTQ